MVPRISSTFPFTDASVPVPYHSVTVSRRDPVIRRHPELDLVVRAHPAEIVAKFRANATPGGFPENQVRHLEAWCERLFEQDHLGELAAGRHFVPHLPSPCTGR